MSVLASHGHLAWPLFAILVFTGLWWLAVDIVWRCVTISARTLAVIALVVWLSGLWLILAVA